MNFGKWCRLYLNEGWKYLMCGMVRQNFVTHQSELKTLSELACAFSLLICVSTYFCTRQTNNIDLNLNCGIACWHECFLLILDPAILVYLE